MWSAPPGQEPTPASSTSWVLATMLVIGMALGGALAGLIGSYMVANRSHPTDADIRAAAKSLVPPGGTVSEYSAGVGGGSPLDPGPYTISFDVTIDEHDFERRKAVFHNLAESTGWTLTGRSSGGGYAQFQRAGLYLAIAVPVNNNVFDATLIVRRVDGARRHHRALGGTLGAVAGMASAALGLAVTRRHRGS